MCSTPTPAPWHHSQFFESLKDMIEPHFNVLKGAGQQLMLYVGKYPKGAHKSSNNGCEIPGLVCGVEMQCGYWVRRDTHVVYPMAARSCVFDGENLSRKSCVLQGTNVGHGVDFLDVCR